MMKKKRFRQGRRNDTEENKENVIFVLFEGKTPKTPGKIYGNKLNGEINTQKKIRKIIRRRINFLFSLCIIMENEIPPSVAPE